MRHYEFQNIDPNILRCVVELYNAGFTTYVIAQKIQKSRPTVSLYLKSQGIVGRKSYRTLALNEEFFDSTNTIEKIYWLGFLLADGHITKRTMKCHLKWTDAHHLEKLKSALQSETIVRKVMMSDGKSKNVVIHQH
jgi:DNA-binding transcriptional regulator WhiA